MMFTRALIASSLVLGSLSITATTAEARPGGWARHHPARVHINNRIARQHVRIAHQVHQGDMSRVEARGLHRDLHEIRMQERAFAMANDNNGHLTRGQVRDLNHQLNQTGQSIRN